MKLRLLLILFVPISNPVTNASTHLTERERAALFVIREEATDFALEARADVCVEFGTKSNLRDPAVLAALRQEGFKFHDGSWCNRGPRGVTIFMDTPERELPSGFFEYESTIGDSDPIRLYGEHFATLLRKSKYVIKCEAGSEPVLDSYQLVCCEKNPLRRGTTPH